MRSTALTAAIAGETVLLGPTAEGLLDRRGARICNVRGQLTFQRRFDRLPVVAQDGLQQFWLAGPIIEITRFAISKWPYFS